MPRNRLGEELLCDAISWRLCAEIKYEDDQRFRLVEPIALYYTEDTVCLSCVQLKNRNNQLEQPCRQIFNVLHIRDARLSNVTYTPCPLFDWNDPKYSRGIICSV